MKNISSISKTYSNLSANQKRAVVSVSTVLCLLTIGLIIYVMMFSNFNVFSVPSSSMEPTLRIGDYILTYKYNDYKIGDIIVVYDRIHKDYIVKRLIGIEGDIIKIRGGSLFRNHVKIEESYLKEPIKYLMFDRVVKPDEIFLLGDNRNNSDDSGSGYEFYKQDIRGKVVCIYLPFHRIQLLI